MGLKRGNTNNRNGRPAGVPNKVTKDVREAFQQLVENNLHNIDTWLQRIADKEPDKALKIILELSEFVIPKLARTETEEISAAEKINVTFVPYIK